MRWSNTGGKGSSQGSRGRSDTPARRRSPTPPRGSSWTTRPCSRCDGDDHCADECRNPIVCWNCREKGHISRECSAPRKPEGSQPSNQ